MHGARRGPRGRTLPASGPSARLPHSRRPVTPLHVYDTLTRREREFEPLHAGEVRLYVCGMTVQDKPHIGHFLPFLTADVVRRFITTTGLVPERDAEILAAGGQITAAEKKAEGLAD